MSKKNKAAAKLKAKRLLPTPKPAPTLPDKSNLEDDELLAPEDLAITTDILSLLATQPSLLSEKSVKPLKRSLYLLSRHLLGDPASSLSSRISTSLASGLYKQALVLLFEMYVGGQGTKLGSLQRWVRDCDATARPALLVHAKDKNAARVEEEEEEETRSTVLKCLDLVLRICSHSIVPPTVGDGWEDVLEQDGVIQQMKGWKIRESSQGGKVQDEEALWELIQEGFSAPPTGPSAGSSLYKIQTTPGPLRRPPNLHPSTVWASTLSNPTISLPPPSLPPFSVSHPKIADCKMLCNIVPAQTCREIISMANQVGWEEDQAVAGSAVNKTSILAHNVVWLADQQFTEDLFARIRPFVPERLGGDEAGNKAGKVRGINRRFRIYRYGPKQVYRPHIDGAWPAAGVDPKTGEYLHDSSPADDPLWSRYTILIYLNSDISPSSSTAPPSTDPTPQIPGATTFFLPHPTSLQTLQSYAIAPVQGSVLVFPHGDARGSLLHEGSPVGEGGWKVVIRTDLLYEAEGFGEFAKGKRKRAEEGRDDGEEESPSKVVKVGRTELVVPRSLGKQNGGDGKEGIGG